MEGHVTYLQLLLGVPMLLISMCQKLNSGPQCFINGKQNILETKRVKKGDFIIGGVFSVCSHNQQLYDIPQSSFLCLDPIPRYYRYLLAFIFAINEINSNHVILPNVTLGYHATDSCRNADKAVESVLRIISGPAYMVPNYSCQDHHNLAGVIGDHTSETSLRIAEILNIYGYVQISYGATNPLLSNKQIYPSFFQTLPSDQTQYLAIVKLLKHFGWTWIGVITSDDDAGENQSQELQKQAAKHGICIEYMISLISGRNMMTRLDITRNIKILNHSTSRVVVLCGTILLHTLYLIEEDSKVDHGKTLIIPASPVPIYHLKAHRKACFRGSFVFSPPAKPIPRFKRFLEKASLENYRNDLLFEYITALVFKCTTSSTSLDKEIEFFYKFTLKKCNSSVQLSDLPSHIYHTDRFGTAYQVYSAVYAMAHALHEMQLYISRKRNTSMKKPRYLLKAS